MNKKSISVVYIITQLELGGAQKVCLSLLKGLQKGGATAYLIAGNKGPLVSHVQENNNVFLLSSLRQDISFMSLFSEIKNFFKIVQTLKQLKKKHPHLIVHTHSTKAGCIGRWAAWVVGIKTRMHTIHGYGFHAHQSWIHWLILYGIELITSFITTHFICVSAHDTKTGMRLLPRFAPNHSIIRAGVDIKQFHTPALHITIPSIHKPFVFGTISCFKPQKNLIDLLHAFKKVAESNSRARLEIIGDGVQRTSLETWIQSHNLSSLITLHGWQQSIAPITKQWHAFVLSSLWEGLPCAIIEARLQHLPIISYKTGGIPEIVHDQHNGYLVAQRDWPMLAERMNRLMLPGSPYRTMQLFPDKLADFDTQHMVAEHIALYMKLLTSQRDLSKFHPSPSTVYNHLRE